MSTRICLYIETSMGTQRKDKKTISRPPMAGSTTRENNMTVDKVDPLAKEATEPRRGANIIAY